MLAPIVALLAAVWALKWTLIGRVKPGQHALWSCWCSRWDYVYVAWAKYANLILQRLEGTFLLLGFLRAMGLTIGKRAVLGPQFAQVVDPDMIHIGDGATVAAMFRRTPSRTRAEGGQGVHRQGRDDRRGARCRSMARTWAMARAWAGTA
jgi:hypothetical protein